MLTTSNAKTAIDEYIKIVFKSTKEQTKKHVKFWSYQSKSVRILCKEQMKRYNY